MSESEKFPFFFLHIIIKGCTKLLPLFFKHHFMNILPLSAADESAGLFSALINGRHVW